MKRLRYECVWSVQFIELIGRDNRLLIKQLKMSLQRQSYFERRAVNRQLKFEHCLFIIRWSKKFCDKIISNLKDSEQNFVIKSIKNLKLCNLMYHLFSLKLFKYRFYAHSVVCTRQFTLDYLTVYVSCSYIYTVLWSAKPIYQWACAKWCQHFLYQFYGSTYQPVKNI